MVRGRDRSQAADGLVQDRLGLVCRIGIEAEDLAQIGFRRGHKHQPVNFGSRQRFLVRKDLALAERRQSQASHETASIVCDALGRELLVIDVDRGVGIGVENPLR
jgi:hypothetical protein